MGNRVPWLFEGFTLLLFIHQEHMHYINYQPFVNDWYDSLNDAHTHSVPDTFGDDHCSRFHQYVYDCIDCINDEDYE